MTPLEQEARNVVVRTRAGDQVAMGLIAQVRDQAKAGNPRAKESLVAIEKYIKKHPKTDIGIEAPSGTTNPKAVNAMWRARTWPEEQFGVVLAKAAPHVSVWHIIAVVIHGPGMRQDGPLFKAAHTANSKLAHCLRTASRIRRLQDPNTPIASYCKLAAWELGE